MSVELLKQKIDAAFEGAADGYAQKLRVALKEIVAELSENSLAGSSQLIATGTELNLNSVGSSNLEFESGKSLTTHFITHMVITCATGDAIDADLLTVSLRKDGVYLINEFLIPAISAGYSAVIPTDTTAINNPMAGSLSFQNKVAYGGSMSCNVKVYGIPY
jgi:hypothetical protein